MHVASSDWKPILTIVILTLNSLLSYLTSVLEIPIHFAMKQLVDKLTGVFFTTHKLPGAHRKLAAMVQQIHDPLSTPLIRQFPR